MKTDQGGEEVSRLGSGSSAAQNIDAVMEFHRREEAKVTKIQVAIERVSDFFGSPIYFAFAVFFMASWIGVNTWGKAAGWEHVDEPPFFLLQGLVSANALLLTIAVLIRQRRMAQLAEHRSHLDLQVNLLTEQKVAKLLEVLHQRMGCDAPAETDPQLEELEKPVDAEALLHAITHRAGDA